MLFIFFKIILNMRFLLAGNVDGIMVLFRPGFVVGHQLSDIFGRRPWFFSNFV